MLTLSFLMPAFFAGYALGACSWPKLRLWLFGMRAEIDRLTSELADLEKLAKGAW